MSTAHVACVHVHMCFMFMHTVLALLISVHIHNTMCPFLHNAIAHKCMCVIHHMQYGIT